MNDQTVTERPMIYAAAPATGAVVLLDVGGRVLALVDPGADDALIGNAVAYCRARAEIGAPAR